MLIRTNPNKYLTESCRPKEGVVLADTYILKKYYGGRVPDVETLETESEIFQTIINSHEAEKMTIRPKNRVIKEMETRGIKWPNTSGQDACPGYPASYSAGFQPFLNPWYQYQQPFMFGLMTCNVTNAVTGARNSIASPPPPPPLPDEDIQNQSSESSRCGTDTTTVSFPSYDDSST